MPDFTCLAAIVHWLSLSWIRHVVVPQFT